MTDTDEQVVTVAHGAGTERTRDLLSAVVTDRFGDSTDEGVAASPDGIGLAALDDGTVVPDEVGPDGDATVVTTDSHVVEPSIFPGGDVGRLAISGTVNDLAAMGATETPTVAAALVLPAGTPVETVDTITASMATACEEADCRLRTGDTKVVGGDELDGIVVTTTGVGRVSGAETLPASGLTPGDRILVTGPVGDHGVALLAAREEFDFASPLESDVRPVAHLVAAAQEAGRVTAATDPTRGGLANAVNELAAASETGVVVDEQAVPVTDATAGAGDLLGIDPFTVACEGRMVFGVHEADAEAVLERLRGLPGGEEAAEIGRVVADHPGKVVLDTGIGQRYLSVPTGERVPRIC